MSRVFMASLTPESSISLWPAYTVHNKLVYGGNQEIFFPKTADGVQGKAIWKGVQKGRELVIQNSTITIKRVKNALIAEMLMLVQGVTVWNLNFRRELRAEEQMRLSELLLLVGDPPCLNPEEEDEIKCRFSNATSFSSRECYDHSCKEEGDKLPSKLLWSKGVPSKTFQSGMGGIKVGNRSFILVEGEVWQEQRKKILGSVTIRHLLEYMTEKEFESF
ncbi:hypothetical protein BVC80_645g86 [Macleaya cordata]|uniref:Uncharacterized protein n=1 Tax=Macleaya cordata TaxID=56857 RepID=A0A200QJZ8_MACCD|nr:hypothetical protein BVC80_645g86 [Macleaya cordata]